MRPERNSDARFLIYLIALCFACRNQKELEATMKEIKRVVPFGSFCIARATIFGGKQLVNFEIPQWLYGDPGFKETYIREQHYWNDSILAPLFNGVQHHLSRLICWDRLDFLGEKNSLFREEPKGFSWFHQLTPSDYFCFLFSGDISDRKQQVESVMKRVAPALATACCDIQIGDLELLSDKEFELWQVMRKNLPLKTVAQSFGLSMGQLRRYHNSIQEKIGKDCQGVGND